MSIETPQHGTPPGVRLADVGGHPDKKNEEPRADTDPGIRAWLSHAPGSAPSAHEIASALVAMMPGGGGGSGGGDGEPNLKSFSRKNWAANTLIALVVAGAGVVATYKVTEARSVANESGVKENREAIVGAKREIADVQVSVETVGRKVDEQTAVQRQLAAGVEKLTVEAKTREEERLRERIKELEEKNERLRRARER